MGYIQEQEVVIKKRICTHPKVVKFWEYGGGSAIPTNSAMVHCASIILDNGEQVEFKIWGNENVQKLIDKVEEYLNTL